MVSNKSFPRTSTSFVVHVNYPLGLFDPNKSLYTLLLNVYVMSLSSSLGGVMQIEPSGAVTQLHNPDIPLSPFLFQVCVSFSSPPLIAHPHTTMKVPESKNVVDDRPQYMIQLHVLDNGFVLVNNDNQALLIQFNGSLTRLGKFNSSMPVTED